MYEADMSDEAALLAAIRTHLDEDTPRLMYADWLEENEQPERAEFIRVQIERARLTLRDARYSALARREAALFGRNEKKWSAPIVAALPGASARYSRGLIEELSAPAAALLANGAAVWPLAPLRRVRVNRIADTLPELGELPRPAGLRLIAELIDDRYLASTGELELLSGAEPWVRSGRWLVLEWPTASADGRRAMTNLGAAIRRHGGSRYLGESVFGGCLLAARTVRDADRVEPTWTLLADGEAISRREGGVSVASLGGDFWEPIGGPPSFAF